jgi:MSHA biogenesis protein MshN
VSVINQMLLDLERRRASGEERNRIPDHVRALPGNPVGEGVRSPAMIAGAVAVILAVMGGGFWWYSGLPGLSKPSMIPSIEEIERRQAEGVTRQMSLDLAQAPKTIESPGDATAPTGIATQSIIVNEPPLWASPRGEHPLAARSTAPAEPLREPAVVPAREPASQAAVSAPAVVTAPAGKPSAKSSATAPAGGIDKRLRELTPRQRAEAEYSRGATALQQGRLPEASSAFEAALQIEPTYHAARQALAGVLMDARLPNDAMLVLQEGLQIAPAQFGFAMMAARLHVERGELDAAVQTLARSAEYAGNSADYAGFYAGLLQRQKKHAEAVEYFDRALRLRPNSGVWLLGMGMSLEALGRNAEAQEAFRRAKTSGNLTQELQNFVDQRLR